MTQADRDKWNRIYSEQDKELPQAAAVLHDHAYLLPEQGLALDLACGRGGNALFLAKQGLQTSAWDISDEAIATLSQLATTAGIDIQVEQRDVSDQPPAPDSFDVIVVSRFLDRNIIPALIQAVRRQGLVFYQTFLAEKVQDVGPGNPAYRLSPNELLQMFSGLHVIHYQEHGLVGEHNQGFRNEAMFIGQRR